MAQAGGLVIFGSFGLMLLIFPELRAAPLALEFLTSFFVILIFGLLDDLRGLNAPLKLLGQVLAALLLIHGGVKVMMFSQEYLNLGLTLFWVIGITNAFNFLDSGDGFALTNAVATAGFLAIAAAISGQIDLALIMVILLGIFIGVFIYNLPPARAFLGDSGAQLTGFMLAAAALHYAPSGYPQSSSWFIPILLFIVPIFDVCLVVVSRIRRRAPIYKASLDHTYHRLRTLFKSDIQLLTSMFLVTGIVDSFALATLNFTPLIANILFGGMVLLGMTGIVFMERIYAEQGKV